ANAGRSTRSWPTAPPSGASTTNSAGTPSKPNWTAPRPGRLPGAAVSPRPGAQREMQPPASAAHDRVLAGQVPRHGQPGLAATDHDHVQEFVPGPAGALELPSHGREFPSISRAPSAGGVLGLGGGGD